MRGTLTQLGNLRDLPKGEGARLPDQAPGPDHFLIRKDLLFWAPAPLPLCMSSSFIRSLVAFRCQNIMFIGMASMVVWLAW